MNVTSIEFINLELSEGAKSIEEAINAIIFLVHDNNHNLLESDLVVCVVHILTYLRIN